MVSDLHQCKAWPLIEQSQKQESEQRAFSYSEVLLASKIHFSGRTAAMVEWPAYDCNRRDNQPISSLVRKREDGWSDDVLVDVFGQW